ncbi:MAG: hypothetical protein ACOY90_13195 [Candidatus Zhuqueibacterota bacterium]
MKTNRSSFYLATLLIFMMSFILPGCYTQLSRPQVDTQDEYYSDENRSEYDAEEAEDYYDDEQYADSTVIQETDVYIHNYYPYGPGWNFGYYDPFYYDYYRWSYVGYYPDFWWDPYSHYWGPGWYVGYSYYDYYYWRNPGYYHNYYGYNNKPERGAMNQREFNRRSPGLADHTRRDEPRNVSRVDPAQNVNRAGRTDAALKNPTIRDDARSVKRAVKQTPSITTRPRTKDNKAMVNDLKKRYSENKRNNTATDARKTIRVKDQPRQVKQNVQRPKITTVPKSRSDASRSTNKNSASPSTSNRSSGSTSDKSNTPPSGSSSSGKSYTPRSSGSSSGSATRSVSAPPARTTETSSTTSKGSTNKK